MRFASEIGYYEFNPFPGNSQIIVSNHAVIYPQFRGNGKGTTMAEDRLTTAAQLGFDYMICTIRDDNEPQLKIADKLEYNYLDTFFNTESQTAVQIFGKQLRR